MNSKNKQIKNVFFSNEELNENKHLLTKLSCELKKEKNESQKYEILLEENQIKLQDIAYEFNKLKKAKKENNSDSNNYITSLNFINNYFKKYIFQGNYCIQLII